MISEGADAHVLTQLDAIAWLFNIRGSDVPFNPVVIAYAIVTKKEARLFMTRENADKKVRAVLKKEVTFEAYSDFPAALHDLAAAKQRVWLDEAGVSQSVVSHLAGTELIFKPSPVALAKAVKNASEIRGSKRAHRRDGAAMVKFLCWLDRAVPKGGVTELSAARRLEEIRRRQPRFQGLSFQTISSYGSHGAVVHYAVTPKTDIPLKPEGTYLIDSGSQYLDATTDVTRTVCLGRPTAEQKDRFTRILKGIIGLTQTSFPHGTSGLQLDVLARRALWEKGLNYGHGTGHGIGAFLNVHEGPQSIAPARGFGIGLEPGMILSIEPGCYKKGEYGLRVENLVLVVKDPVRTNKTSLFYTFETLTLCPIELRLVNRDLLTEDELKWLNAYHRRVRKELISSLEKDEAAWLEKATRPI
jgi:Xaa-Pro aminopeptidase